MSGCLKVMQSLGTITKKSIIYVRWESEAQVYEEEEEWKSHGCCNIVMEDER